MRHAAGCGVKVYPSVERPGITPVYGTSTPPAGLSGKMRDVAYRYAENDLRHWLILLLADRVNVGEGLLEDLARGHLPNIYREMGGPAELRYNRAGFVRSLQPGLSRAERRQLVDLLFEAVTPFLEAGDDPEMEAVAGRHADGKLPASSPQEDEPASDAAGLEGPADDWERQAAAAAAQRAQWAAKRRAASASKRRRQEDQEVSQSVRDVYRRLASVLHPDREREAQQRERKTALMQQANQAYAKQDLLALLELQLQAERMDAARLATGDRRRLQHYVVVLQAQLADLQSETRRLEAGFRDATGLPAGSGLQPRKADRIISSEAQRMRTELLMLRRQVQTLLDGDAVKGWLQAQRRR